MTFYLQQCQSRNKIIAASKSGANFDMKQKLHDSRFCPPVFKKKIGLIGLID